MFVLLVMIHGVFVQVCSASGIQYSYSMIFYNWSFYFYLGYSMDHIISKKHYPYCLLFGVLALAVTTLLKYKGMIQNVHDLSPVFMVLVIGEYIFLSVVANHVPKIMRGFFSFLAKYSFSVFLCHMMVLETIAKLLPKSQGVASIGNHILLAFLTLIISVAIAVIMDNTLIRWIRFCARTMYTSLSDSFQKSEKR